MEFLEDVLGDVVVMRMSGQVMGGPESEKFQQLIYDAVQKGIINCVVDLQKTTWMNSSGLGMLISGLTILRGSGGDLRLANVSDRLRRPLEITRLDRVFQLYDSVESAISSYNTEVIDGIPVTATSSG